MSPAQVLGRLSDLHLAARIKAAVRGAIGHSDIGS